MQRELILVRHAKSAWPIGVHDDLRPLNERGTRDATELGRTLSSYQPLSQVVSSPAVRALSTAELAVAALPGSQPEIQLAPELYEATWPDVLGVIHAIEPKSSRALLIGHNPSIAESVLALTGASDQAEWLRAVQLKFPTCAMAVLRSDHLWSQWESGCATLAEYSTPRSRSAGTDVTD